LGRAACTDSGTVRSRGLLAFADVVASNEVLGTAHRARPSPLHHDDHLQHVTLDQNTMVTLDKNTTDAEWKTKLTDFEFKVLRQKGTEPRGGEYDGFYPKAGEGYFACKGCGKPLYSAAAKFKSGCGWPAFDKCYKDAVDTFTDSSHGMQRIEITCAGCGGHLGHVFVGEMMTQTNERHCVNSVSVKFVKGSPASASAEEIVTQKGNLD
jgi:peptide-methionine (R)-S-oxide reductase